MTKSEVMKCAAVLAAGIMANQAQVTVYNEFSAVELMEKIATVIAEQEKKSDIQYPII